MTEIFRIIQRVCEQRKYSNRTIIIGVNGLDCSGKSYFGKSLKKHLMDINISTSLADVDHFNVKSVENSTYESFSNKQFSKNHFEKYYNQIIDFKLARKKIRELRKNYSVIIIEGIFIYKKEFIDLFDFKVFFEIDYQIAKERFQIRHERNKDARPIEIFDKIWLPSHHRYLKEVEPENLSDLVINNSDYLKPEIMRYDPIK